MNIWKSVVNFTKLNDETNVYIGGKACIQDRHFKMVNISGGQNARSTNSLDLLLGNPWEEFCLNNDRLFGKDTFAENFVETLWKEFRCHSQLIFKRNVEPICKI